MSDWKSLFPFVGEKTVARRLNDLMDRQNVISALFGAMLGGLITTVITLLSPSLKFSLILWAIGLLAVPLFSIYWKTIQRKWGEVTDED